MNATTRDLEAHIESEQFEATRRLDTAFAAVSGNQLKNVLAKAALTGESTLSVRLETPKSINFFQAVALLGAHFFQGKPIPEIYSRGFDVANTAISPRLGEAFIRAHQGFQALQQTIKDAGFETGKVEYSDVPIRGDNFVDIEIRPAGPAGS